MLRVTTLYAGSAAATAKYYTQYLTQAPGEEPGGWTGAQSAGLGLTGDVSTDALELLLCGRDPITGTTLGYPLKDRTRANGTVIRAVAGFDATLSAPKSLSVWWALTGDPGLAECHDVAAQAVVDYLERFGSTTRVRSNGGRLHPDSQGLTVAAFRQTTSRLDDPQLHTHLVISAKVQTDDGRWLALDARVLKHHQRALGGLYQSVLRAELTNRYGGAFGEIVKGQAEVAGVPVELMQQFSKRAAQVDAALQDKIDEFRQREGRHPSKFEHAALEREAAADTRHRKTGHGVPDSRARWRSEAADIGVTADTLNRSITDAARVAFPPAKVSVADVIEDLSAKRSAWHRMDVLEAVTDRLRPQPGVSGERWARLVDRAVERVLDECVDLDPAHGDGRSRASDGRSLWIEPVAAHVTSRQVIAQEEAILTWALDAQLDEPQPSITVRRDRLDVLQADAAAAVGGHDRLVVIVGPAGAGKTTMLRAAVTDLEGHGRPVFGVAPTAEAARVLERETGMPADTVAKLLHEWARTEGPRPEWRLSQRTTLVVDEAGMLSTPDLHRLTQLASSQQWRLALVGDPRQLQAVGRGGMFAELCTTCRPTELERIHRFTNKWEAAASLQLRHGDIRALDAYEAHGRIIPGTIDEHLDAIADDWIERHAAGETVAITTTTNDHVDAINHLIQQRRIEQGDLDPTVAAMTADGEAVVGDIVATRRNQRQLQTTTGEVIRNRELWTVTQISDAGDLTVAQLDGQGTVTLPAEYVCDHVRLGYAATEPGNQSDTQTGSITLATPATTGRGLYVAMTRGQQENSVRVVTETHDIAEACDILQGIMTSDRADVPAVAQRRQLAQQDRQPIRLQPRCEVPEWFDDLRREAAAEYREARHALEDSEAKRQRLTEAVDVAQQRSAEANTLCAPFDEAFQKAQDAVKRAAADRREAERKLAESGIRGRRQIRAEHAVAADGLTVAEAQLARAKEKALGPDSIRTEVRQELEAARRDLRSHDQIERWSYLPERLQAIEDRIDALDTWREWAVGRDVDGRRLTATVETLDQHASTSQLNGAGELVRVACAWAMRHGVELIEPCLQHVEPAGLEIEF